MSKEHAPLLQFLRVREFEKFQHYKDRKPPWIKLYVSLLCSPDVSDLSDTCRWHVVAIMLLASQHDNKIPFKKRWIAETIQAKSRINWDSIFSSGLVECYQDDSNMLASRKQSADGETETYKEYKEEADPPIVPQGGRAASADAVSSADGDSVLLFADFWKAYPRKIGKEAALKAWRKLKPDTALLTKMLDALDWQKKAWLDPQFIPHPGTYLNGRRWEDDHEPVGSANGGQPKKHKCGPFEDLDEHNRWLIESREQRRQHEAAEKSGS